MRWTGEGWENELSEQPQDYVVIPDQPWLDGFSVMKGMIRQFVAMPLGEGYTAEEQLTGEAEHGGLQIVVYPIKPSYYEREEEQLHFVAYGPPRAEMELGEMGSGSGRAYAAGDIRGRLWLGGVGDVGALALLRAYREHVCSSIV